VRLQLENIDDRAEVLDQSMRHYLAQIEQITSVVKVTHEIDIEWPNLDSVRQAYESTWLYGTHGHGKTFGEPDALIPISPTASAPRSHSMSLVASQPLPRSTLPSHSSAHTSPGMGLSTSMTKSQSQSRPSRRKSIIVVPSYNTQALYGAVTVRPRRKVLIGGKRVDLIQALELGIQGAHERYQRVLGARVETAAVLGRMIEEIKAITAQKDQVAAWLKRVLEEVSQPACVSGISRYHSPHPGLACRRPC
jgi:hypothetical protein